MKTIVTVLSSGGDFSFKDVELLNRHVLGKWRDRTDPPHIICLYDKVKQEYNLGNVTLLPLKTSIKGTWSRIMLYSPEMEKYRPFLYVDLDTAIVSSLENIFDIIPDPSKFICLEDFWQPGKLATGLVWFPANSKKVKNVWDNFDLNSVCGFRMDLFLRNYLSPDLFFQQIPNNNIFDFKPKSKIYLNQIPKPCNLICFHGKPRIFEVNNIKWVIDYVNYTELMSKVTVIIPYNKDRGWLKDAINSVPISTQLIVSKGDRNWPTQFNNVLAQAEGEYIKYLHEDDMLTLNCIEDSVKAMEEQNADFIHGNVIEFYQGMDRKIHWKPKLINPSLRDMLQKNHLHSASLMYRKSVFEKLGGFDESLNTAEEYEFNLRCMKAGLKLGYCNSYLAYYRRHNAQKVRIVSNEDKNKERQIVRNKYNNC